MVPRLLGTFRVRWLLLARESNVGAGWHEGRIFVLCLPSCWPTLARVIYKVRGFVC